MRTTRWCPGPYELITDRFAVGAVLLCCAVLVFVVLVPVDAVYGGPAPDATLRGKRRFDRLARSRRSSILAAPHVFRIWYPGYLPGPFGRNTFVLSANGERASLKITAERPKDDKRRDQNPSAWRTDPSVRVELVGKLKRRPGGVTVWLGKTPSSISIVLICRTKTARVHPAGATLKLGTCSPCYDTCRSADVATWLPRRTRSQRGLDCVIRDPKQVREDGRVLPGTDPTHPGIPGIRVTPERLFFAPHPGVELLIGPTDCPPQGFRDPG